MNDFPYVPVHGEHWRSAPNRIPSARDASEYRGQALGLFLPCVRSRRRYGQKERPLDALPRSLEAAETADSRQEQNSQARHRRRERLNGSRFMR